MTEEQYLLLVQYASDLRSAICAYEDEYGIINLETNPISEIVDAGAKLIHLADSIEPVHSALDGDSF